MTKLPDDMFRQHFLHYLTVLDIVRLDYACLNHKYRPQLLAKIAGVILEGDSDRSMYASLFKWLGLRQIYWVNMKVCYFPVDNDYLWLTSCSMQNDYVDQFRYTQHVIIQGSDTYHTLDYVIPRCHSLQSIVLSGYHSLVKDNSLLSIAKYGTGMQSLTLTYCRDITDTGIITFAQYCTGLTSLDLTNCYLITDISVKVIALYCTRLERLDLSYCSELTDDSIVSLSTNCLRLKSLSLMLCTQITDTSVRNIAHYAMELQSIDLIGCSSLTSSLRRSFKSLSELRGCLLLLYSTPILLR